MDRYTLLYLMDIQQRPYCIAHTTLLSVTWQLGWGRSLGGKWEHIYIHMAGSLCWSFETIMILFINQLYPKCKIKSCK